MSGSTRKTRVKADVPTLTRAQRRRQLHGWMANPDEVHLVTRAFKKCFAGVNPKINPTTIELILNAEYPG